MAAFTIATGDNRPFNLGGWRVEPALDCLCGQGETVRLEPKAMAVLVYLAANAERVVSGEELIAEIWNGQPMGDTPVYKAIAQLRKALGDDPRKPIYIATVPRKGYRVVAPVAAPGTDVPSTRPRRLATLVPNRSSRFHRWLLFVVATAAVLVAAVAFYTPDLGVKETNSERRPGHSIAVMPFSVEAGVDARIPMTGRGIAEGLANRLANAPFLDAIAPASAEELSGRGLEMDAIAGLLGVDYVLLGNLHVADDGLAVNGSLLDSGGRETWNFAFTGGEEDIFMFLGEIAERMTGCFRPEPELDITPACGDI